MTKILRAIEKIMSRKVPWGVWAVCLPLVLQSTILRKRGLYNYRRLISIFCVFLTSIVSSAAMIVLKIVGKSRYNSMFVATVHRAFVKIFLGVETVLEGRENIPSIDQPAMYVYNHQTLMDYHFMCAAMPKHGTPIMKDSIKYIPVFGQFLMLWNGIFMDRKNSKNAITQARYVAKEMTKSGTSVIAFPEGTRAGVKDISLLPFKKGMFFVATQAKVPIVPVVIANYKHIYNPDKKYFGSGTLRVKVLPPISTENIGQDGKSVAELADYTRRQMLVALKNISIPHDGVRAKI